MNGDQVSFWKAVVVDYFKAPFTCEDTEEPRMSPVKAVTAWFEMLCRKFRGGTEEYDERLRQRNRSPSRNLKQEEFCECEGNDPPIRPRSALQVAGWISASAIPTSRQTKLLPHVFNDVVSTENIDLACWMSCGDEEERYNSYGFIIRYFSCISSDILGKSSLNSSSSKIRQYYV
jgi:hypothetical protein